MIFGPILAMFLRSQSYDFDAIAHTGTPLGVELLSKILWKLYEQFEKFGIFIERSGEKTIRLHK